MENPDPVDIDGSEARWESSGQFSLDPAAMRETLGRHQFAHPAYYVLKLVQAAVSNGASYFHVASRTGGFDFEFDGPGWSGEELNGLLTGNSESHVRHLASGLWGALALRPDHWEVRCGSIRLGPDGISAGESRYNGLSFRWTPGWGRSLIQVLGMGRWVIPELRLLGQRARLAPIPILINGNPINAHPVYHAHPLFQSPFLSPRGVNPVHCAEVTEGDGFCFFLAEPGRRQGVPGASKMQGQGLAWWRGQLDHPDSWQPVPSAQGKGRILNLGGPSGQIEASGGLPGLYYGGRPMVLCRALIEQAPQTARQASQLTVVHDGVCWDTEFLQDFPAKFKIVVSSQGLRPDLSQFKLVQDEAYWGLLQHLRRLIEVTWK